MVWRTPNLLSDDVTTYFSKIVKKNKNICIHTSTNLQLLINTLKQFYWNREVIFKSISNGYILFWNGLYWIIFVRLYWWKSSLVQIIAWYWTRHYLNQWWPTSPMQNYIMHDDVIKWKHFPRYWPFVRGIYRSPVNYPHKGQWRRALMFSFICVWINGWVNNREAGDLRRHRAHLHIIVMINKPTPVSTPSGIQCNLCLPQSNQIENQIHSTKYSKIQELIENVQMRMEIKIGINLVSMLQCARTEPELSRCDWHRHLAWFWFIMANFWQQGPFLFTDIN